MTYEQIIYKALKEYISVLHQLQIDHTHGVNTILYRNTLHDFRKLMTQIDFFSI